MKYKMGKEFIICVLPLIFFEILLINLIKHKNHSLFSWLFVYFDVVYLVGFNFFSIELIKKLTL